MMNEQEIQNYLDRLLMQKNMFSKVDIDPYNEEEDVHEYKQIIAEHDGQINALNRVLGKIKPVEKRNIKFMMFGYSDDNIEIEGDIREEIGSYDRENEFFLSDGTTGTIEYTNEGVWRIKILTTTPSVNVTIIHPTQFEIDADTNYTDKAMFTGDIEWIMFDSGTLFKTEK